MSAEVRFETSGTTGAPVGWNRTPAQLRAEARLVADHVLGPIDRIVCFAPPQHLYGWLYGRVLPALRAVTVVDAWGDPLAPPPSLRGRVLLVCLPATWQVLRRCVDRLDAAEEVVALHSTAVPPPAAHELAGRLDPGRFRAVELLGSTETGAVAHRPIEAELRPAAPWHLLPDVQAELTGGGEQPLTVAGPRLARRDDEARPPETWTMPDLVRAAGPGRFVRVGRKAEMVKVNGRRCLLSEIEERVRQVVPGSDAAAVPVPDAVRGEHYELYYSAAETGESELRDLLAADASTGLPAPRAVWRVDVVPRGVSGKIDRARLVGAHR